MAVHPNVKTTPLAEPRDPGPEITAAKRLKMPDFQSACEEKGVKPTKRQAAKYNAGRNRWNTR